MTNEQAINLITRISYSQHDAEKREALEMAVRALFSQQIVNDSQGLVNDCISRKMAIDAVAKWFYDVVDITESDGTATIFERLRELPSAQPERTCVNCGRTVNNGGWYADGRTRCPIEEHYALLKDGYCHLWEKRNITDDDYPERRSDDSV